MKAMKVMGSVGIFGLTAMFVSMAHAGAGANVNACINLPVKPNSPLTVKVSAARSGTHCMNDAGNDTSFTVSAAGVTCSSVGYVEAKASSTKGDLCATDTSTWPLSYSITNTAYSGSTQSSWSGAGSTNSVNLNNPSKNTVVCGTNALCNSTSWQWNHGTQGPLYIIFQPQGQ